METNRTNQVIAPLIRALRTHGADDGTDGQLLEQFVAQHDESAFAALVRRHGSMVLGVCKRILGNEADAEDAFQATFIVLVRKASSLRSRPVLGDWLHGVARCTALRARGDEARRRAKELAIGRAAAPAPAARNDWLPLLDDAVSQLPEKYRLPIVLCDLEGRTRQETAAQLGWPEGTVAGRLARGREMLAKRLLRGTLVAAGAASPALTASIAQVALSADLTHATVQAASAAVGGMTGAVASVKTLTLAQEVMKTLLWNHLKTRALVILLAVVTVSVGGLTLSRVLETPGLPPDQGREPHANVNTPRNWENPVVRELNLAGVQHDPLKFRFPEPTKFTSAAELARVFPDPASRARIEKQVDFRQEALLFFHWPDQGEDRLSYQVVAPRTSADRGPAISFQCASSTAERDLDSNIYTHLYAVPRDATWTVTWIDAVVRELDLKGFTPPPPHSDFGEPATISNRQDLAKVIPDKLWQEKIARQTDFARERLVYFAWAGSGADTLTPRVDGKGGLVVVFQSYAGATKDDRLHGHLYAIPRTVRWRVERLNAMGQVTPRIIREINLTGFDESFLKAQTPAITKVASTLELANLLSDPGWQEKIATQTDFTSDYLLCIHWQGSVSDRLRYRIAPGENRPDLFFQLQHGLATLDRNHVHLYAISRKYRWLMNENVRFGDVPASQKPAVHELDLPGFTGKHPTGEFTRPLAITDAQQLALVIPDKAWQARIAKQIDFAKDQLLFFGWSGPRQERLSFEIVRSEIGPIVLFQHTQATTPQPRDNVAAHVGLIGLPRAAAWSLHVSDR